MGPFSAPPRSPPRPGVCRAFMTFVTRLQSRPICAGTVPAPMSNAKLPVLATYMGHVSIVSTEYYLQFVEPLAASASDQFARHCGALVTSAPADGGAR